MNLFPFFVVASFTGLFIGHFQSWVIDPLNLDKTIVVDGHPIRFRRLGASGTMEITGESDLDFARGVGWAHGQDRYTQMIMQRAVLAGRLTELLKGSDEKLIAVDTAFRHANILGMAKKIETSLDKKAKALLEAYSRSINEYVLKQGLTLEFMLPGLGHTPEPWQPVDTIATWLLMSWAGLATVQSDAEKLIIQTIRSAKDDEGIDRIRMLKSLFSPHLDHLDDATIALIQNPALHISNHFVPEEVSLNPLLAVLRASNNWAISGKLSASGSTLQANDPHLPINRLPGVWYEIVFHNSKTKENWAGITVPGGPVLVMGRNQHVSFGLTYGFMDQIDYFFEEVKNGQVRRGDKFVPLTIRDEPLVQKDGAPTRVLRFFETEYGTLEVEDPHLYSDKAALKDGIYLARAWSFALCTGHHITPLSQLPRWKSVTEAQEALQNIPLSANYIMADTSGNIGYQQAGLLPWRRHGHQDGLLPLPAWEVTSKWNGSRPVSELTRILNPESGFVVTANNDLSNEAVASINLHMGTRRVDRAEALIAEKLAKNAKLTVADMKRMQLDVYATEADVFLPLFDLSALNTLAARTLSAWNREYSIESTGAVLYESLVDQVVVHVFGRLFGQAGVKHLMHNTMLYGVLRFAFTELIIQAPQDATEWFGSNGKKALLQEIAGGVLGSGADVSTVWGDRNNMVMTNILFDGQLPSFLGFDFGPVAIAGGPGTLSQGHIGKDKGRIASFCASWRYVTDLASSEIHTSLPSGVSGRRFSGLYLAEVQDYFDGVYKTLHFVQ